MTGSLPLSALPPRPASSIILISVDTLRADHLGCYGYRKIRTPNVDGLAQGGTLFSLADSTVPLTLPAHTSLLTSTYPFVHGVEENGQQVGSGLITLGEVLKGNGYRTAAFIGGYVLDARFGLNRGFDVYDGPFHLRPDPGEDPPEIKRPADAVLGAAREWIESVAGHRFFAFIHLYDAHQPYSHSSYDGEIAYIDQAVGRFRRSLTRRLVETTLIVLTSDHGESLGEHGEDTHGYFIYESTLRVPLILHWPAGGGEYPARVEDPVSLVDVAPALLEFVGIGAPSHFQGRSLLRLLDRRSATDEPVYGESMYARDHLGCSALRSVRVGRYKYIDAPRPELYDLDDDPHETQNRFDRDRDVAAGLRARLLSLPRRERKAGKEAVSPEAVSRLRSLGYLGGPPAAGTTGADPKDRLPEYRRYGRAVRLANAGQYANAIGEFEKVLEEDRQSAPARFYLAVCEYRLGRLDEAVKALKATLAASPDYAPAEQLLGSIWLMKEDFARAREQFSHLAAIAPGNFGAHYNLGILAMRDGRVAEAVNELEAASRADTGSPQVHAALGSLYFQQGDWNRAREELRQAVALDAHDEASRKLLEKLKARQR